MAIEDNYEVPEAVAFLEVSSQKVSKTHFVEHMVLRPQDIIALYHHDNK